MRVKRWSDRQRGLHREYNLTCRGLMKFDRESAEAERRRRNALIADPAEQFEVRKCRFCGALHLLPRWIIGVRFCRYPLPAERVAWAGRQYAARRALERQLCMRHNRNGRPPGRPFFYLLNYRSRTSMREDDTGGTIRLT